MQRLLGFILGQAVKVSHLRPVNLEQNNTKTNKPTKNKTSKQTQNKTKRSKNINKQNKQNKQTKKNHSES